jgi:hypothetical protein
MSLATPLKLLGLIALLFVLTSINYAGLGLSASLSSPLALILAALMDTLVLDYFVMSSRFQGWKEWAVVFSVLYGSNYVLTAMESVYLTSLLTANVVASILVNGAIISGVFAFALVELVGSRKSTESNVVQNRLRMPTTEWIWKILCSGAIYLVVFILFGLAVYGPLATTLDKAAYVAKQAAIPASAAALVFPLEFLRGLIWTILAIVASISLPFSWRKTALVVGLLLAVPLSLNIFLSSAIVPGLQIAHFVELFGENLVFGIIAVWILHPRSRLSAPGINESAHIASDKITVS